MNRGTGVRGSGGTGEWGNGGTGERGNGGTERENAALSPFQTIIFSGHTAIKLV